MKPQAISRKSVSVLAAISLVLTGVTAVSAPASASTAYEVHYNGNTIGTAVPASQSATRDQSFTLPVAASVTGTRTGYTFGGWSRTIGGASVSSEPYAITYTEAANRLDLYAVWNTTVNYDLNGATSGTLTGGKTSDPYRFGQTLTLPVSGTVARTGYSFGGWLPATSTGTRSTTYTAASTAVGNPTLYAAWIRSLSFNGNGSTSGTVPSPLTYLAGGAALTLPIYSEMTLRRTGMEFAGWSTTLQGPVITTTTFIPTIEAQTLYAVWKPEVVSGSTKVFFKVGSSFLRGVQKYELRLLKDRLAGKKNINVIVTSTRPKGAPRALGTSRNRAVIKYFESLGITASYSRSVKVGPSRTISSPKNNRVIVRVRWVN